MHIDLAVLDKLLDKRDVKKAEVTIAKYLRADLSSSDQCKLMLYRARVRLLGARPDDALSDLQWVQEHCSKLANDVRLLQVLADSYFSRFEQATVGFSDRNDITHAEQIYTQILSDFPSFENAGWISYQLGRIHLVNNRSEDAEQCFRQALFQPSDVTALTAYCFERLGFTAYYERRDSSIALNFLNKAIYTYPATEDTLWLVQVYILRSRILRSSNYVLALESAEKALNIASSGRRDNRHALAESLFAVAEVLSEQSNREKEQINHIQQFLQMSKRPLGVDVTWSRAYEMLGDAYFALGQHEEAINSYFSALQFNPYHPWEVSVYYRIACSYYQQSNYHKAIQAIEQVFELSQTDGQEITDYRVYDVLGNAYFALEQYDRATDAYTKAVQLAPPHENIDKTRRYLQFAMKLREPL